MYVVDRRVVRGIERRGGGTTMWLRLLIRSGSCSGFGRKRNPNGMKQLTRKQMVSKNKDIAGDGCIKDSEGNVVVEQDKIKEVWRKHYEKLLNEEFDWNQESLEVADAVSGPAEEITQSDVRAAIAN